MDRFRVEVLDVGKSHARMLAGPAQAALQPGSAAHAGASDNAHLPTPKPFADASP
jgi:hypothetical protein